MMSGSKIGNWIRKKIGNKPSKPPKPPRVFYYNAAGQKVTINPQRSRLMKQVMSHRVGKPLSDDVKRKISESLKKTHSSGRCQSGRPVAKRKPKQI